MVSSFIGEVFPHLFLKASFVLTLLTSVMVGGKLNGGI